MSTRSCWRACSKGSAGFQAELYAAISGMSVTLINATVDKEQLTRESIAECVDKVLGVNPEWKSLEVRREPDQGSRGQLRDLDRDLAIAR